MQGMPNPAARQGSRLGTQQERGVAAVLQVVVALLGVLSFGLLFRDESAGELWVALCLAVASWEALRRSSHPVVQAAALAAAVTIAVLLASA